MTSATSITPVTLSGRWVELEPLQAEHSDALWAVGQHESLWRYMPFAIESADAMQGLVTSLLGQQAQGQAQPFVTKLVATGEVIGSTSFLAMDLANRRLEIGATWITPDHQRSAANTEAKLLQLQYAFERLQCNRVEFKTDARNTKSRAALARLGAVEEGTFRQHMVLPSGWIRDSVYFSIVTTEFAAVRDRLSKRLGA
jgi:RimJ/RimL family protein N-acetyltransferase